MSASWDQTAGRWVPEQVPAVLNEGLGRIELIEELVRPRVRGLAESGCQMLPAQDVEDVGGQVNCGVLVVGPLPEHRPR
jgi:hypothetical protein